MYRSDEGGFTDKGEEGETPGELVKNLRGSSITGTKAAEVSTVTISFVTLR